VVTPDDVWAALQAVQDPEYPISVVDLGMVYGVEVTGGTARVAVTFTSIGCPAIDMISSDIRDAVGALDGVAGVEIEVVWSPPWTSERISPRGRRVLALHGVVN